MTDAVADTRGWQGWRTVLWLGVVSLLVDLVYEGARSITGPFLASLGASALTVGLVTGAGEAAALGFRVFSGPAADRTGRYWRWMVIGYVLTAVCVPLMALAPALGGAGLAFAAAMVLLERTGKAIRSPAKSVLLAVAALNVGRGRGFGWSARHSELGRRSHSAPRARLPTVGSADRHDLTTPAEGTTKGEPHRSRGYHRRRRAANGTSGAWPHRTLFRDPRRDPPTAVTRLAGLEEPRRIRQVAREVGEWLVPTQQDRECVEPEAGGERGHDRPIRRTADPHRERPTRDDD